MTIIDRTNYIPYPQYCYTHQITGTTQLSSGNVPKYLVDNSTTTVSTLVGHCEKQEQEKDTTMSSKASIRNNEIHYLVNQIHNVRDELMERAYSKYLGDDPEPKTKDEMQKRIADGMFTVESFFEDGRHPCIHWRSPDKKKDYAGYEKTKENIDQAFQTARDAANVLPAPDALNELKKFKEFQV